MPQTDRKTASASPTATAATTAATTVRIALGSLGVAALGFGAYELFTLTRPGDPLNVALWLAGAVALHDGLLVPLVLGAGLFVGRSGSRTALRGGLLTAGCLTLLALPLMLRPGKPNNPTVLPLDYPVNWALALALTALATACVAWATRPRRARRTSEPSPPPPGTD
ncbi:hypothetical protein [Streptomyces sp. SID3212]|uniref:hypothetical protein n=1 Tax=Streptomyces sp. SID3212 TaxID=2690259 RepID=UPI0019264ED5|nr:hypothetical protein [Streptomyces sp. SID3212]